MCNFILKNGLQCKKKHNNNKDYCHIHLIKKEGIIGKLENLKNENEKKDNMLINLKNEIKNLNKTIEKKNNIYNKNIDDFEKLLNENYEITDEIYELRSENEKLYIKNNILEINIINKNKYINKLKKYKINHIKYVKILYFEKIKALLDEYVNIYNYKALTYFLNDNNNFNLLNSFMPYKPNNESFLLYFNKLRITRNNLVHTTE
jgi:hypothetical protein